MPHVLPGPTLGGKPNQRLIEQVRHVMRLKHYSSRTERTYWDWMERFIRFRGLRHPSEMAAREVGQFLTHLAREQNVAAATQNQALSALLFLYKEALKKDFGRLGGGGKGAQASAPAGGAEP